MKLRTRSGVDQHRLKLGIWLNGRRRFCCTLAMLNGYLGGLMMEASCLMMVVEWIDDGGWEVGWVDDDGLLGCVGSVKEMIM